MGRETERERLRDRERAKQKKQQHQQEKVSRTVPEPSTPPTGGVVADPREHGDLGARRTLFPTPPTRRARATSAPSGSDIEGIAPIHQSAPRVADAQTQTQTAQNQDCCPLRERSYANIAYELKAKENFGGW